MPGTKGPSARSAPSPPRSGRPRGDGDLVDAIAAGDQAALAEAYSEHASRVHGLARQLCGQSRAEELTQELFLQLWKHPERYRATRGSLRTFLLTQAHSRALDMIRSDTARTARQSSENVRGWGRPAETDADALAVLERAELHERVTALPETQRHPIVLAYFGGLTYHDVAVVLGVPEGTIKSRIRSGLKRLRTELSAEPNLT